MDTFSSFVDRRAPVPSGANCATAAMRFAAEPDAVVLAVVDGETPVGLVTREVVLSQTDGQRSLSEVMDRAPAIADAGMTPWGFLEHLRATRPDALNHGFIVVDHGRYVGVGTPATLLTARRSRARAPQDPLYLD